MDGIRSRFRFALRLLAFGVITLLFLLLLEISALLGRKTPRIRWINQWVSRWGRTLLRVFRVRLAANGPFAREGQPYPSVGGNGVGRIFVMNHRSGFDIPAMLAVAEAHMISRHDLARWPLVGLGARRIGTLFVDRTSRRSGAGVLREVEAALLRGEGVGMFPEGTVFSGDEVHEFRPGAFTSARRAGAEIVPLGIAYAGAEEAFAATTFGEHMKRIGALPHLDVAIELGEPIVSQGVDPLVLRDQVRQAVQELVHRARQRLDAIAPQGTPPSE
jgi:lyso-ornithine lipid O-acyltransferase